MDYPSLGGVGGVQGNFEFGLVVFGDPAPPAGPPGPPGMRFPPKAPMGLGQIDDPQILAPIRNIRFFGLSLKHLRD